MKVVFRVDASFEMGSGHVMRCLTLADELHRQGHDCVFICRQQPGDLTDTIKARGYVTHALPPCDTPADNDLAHSHWLKGGQQKDAEQSRAFLETLTPDWLVVDHYGMDKTWERELRGCATHILVVDDLADRAHDCDILLDQNLGRTEAMYQSLVPADCQVLTGCDHALLRPEFADERERSLAYRKGKTHPDRLLVTMGGVDKDNQTGKALQALDSSALDDKTEVTVVLGKQAPWLREVKAQAANSRLTVRVLSNVSDMAELMSRSDLAIGAAGSTAWERCCLGLPTLLCVLADNQQPGADALDTYGAAIRLRGPDTETALCREITALQRQPQRLSRLSEKAAQLVDGRGTGRVVKTMTQQTFKSAE